jgi:hypothetical protein
MHLKPTNDRRRLGDQWTFLAIDPQTKLITAYHVGKRTRDNAVAFMADLSERPGNRVQISSDSLRSYVDAVERAFGADVDYGQIVKFYDAEPIGPGRYAPPRVTGVERTVIAEALTKPTFRPAYREVKPRDADEHEPVYSPNQRIQQEAGELAGGDFAALCALQSRSAAQDSARYAGDGC